MFMFEWFLLIPLFIILIVMSDDRKSFVYSFLKLFGISLLISNLAVPIYGMVFGGSTLFSISLLIVHKKSRELILK